MTPAQASAAVADMRSMNCYPPSYSWSAMWTNYRPEVVSADFARIRALGANTVRLHIFPQDFGYDPVKPWVLARLDDTMARAKAANLRVQLSLFTWWHKYDDVAGSQRWAKAILAGRTDHSAVALIEVQNEVPLTAPNVGNWLRALVPHVRSVANGIPVSVSTNYNLNNLDWLHRSLATVPPDVYDFHYYGDSYQALDVLRQAQKIVAPQPLVIGEAGYITLPNKSWPTPSAQEARQGDFLASVIWAARVLGLPTPAPWTLWDYDPATIPPSFEKNDPASWNYGLLRRDGSEKPAAGVYRDAIGAPGSGGSLSPPTYNAGFERTVLGVDAKPFPASWQISGQGAITVRTDTGVVHSAGTSVALSGSCGTSTANPPYLVATPTTPEITAGRVYRFDAWVLGQGATGDTRVSVAFYDRNNRYLGQALGPRLSVSGTWTLLSTSGAAPVGSTWAQVAIKTGNNCGTVWVDDTSFSLKS